jgi:hypothetical protein
MGMTVYVDDFRARYARMVTCHILADSDAELHAMAAAIGVDRRLFQHQASKPWRDHYDICLAKRQQAIARGAVLVSRKEVVRLLRRKRGLYLPFAMLAPPSAQSPLPDRRQQILLGPHRHNRLQFRISLQHLRVEVFRHGLTEEVLQLDGVGDRLRIGVVVHVAV